MTRRTCKADLGALRDQVDLFGRLASDATAWRVIETLDAERLEGVREARARARGRAWAAGARPGEIVLDIDSTLVTAHSISLSDRRCSARGSARRPWRSSADGPTWGW